MPAKITPGNGDDSEYQRAQRLEIFRRIASRIDGPDGSVLACG